MKGSGDLATSYLMAADILAMAGAGNDDCVRHAAYRAANRFRARGNAILNGADQTRGEGPYLDSPLVCPTDR